ncbi:MAG TPA: HEPN domain-containing protein, partial [Thermodesulfovibrionales bacterium]|nr:HEPN domain-containing protein [Thermodesulfovibrionales bacterium]
DASDTLRSGLLKTSVNRSYYAVLHSARSLLVLKGIDPTQHDGVKTMLSLHFIKTKLLPENIIKDFKNLLSLRTDVDYGDFESIDKKEAKDALNKAVNFLKVIERERKKLIKEMTAPTRKV